MVGDVTEIGRGEETLTLISMEIASNTDDYKTDDGEEHVATERNRAPDEEVWRRCDWRERTRVLVCRVDGTIRGLKKRSLANK